jgi:hypothetical protein
MTSPVSGTSTAWNILGLTAPSDLVTAIMAPFNGAAVTGTVSGTTVTSSSGTPSTSNTAAPSDKKSGSLKTTPARSNGFYALGALFFLMALL